MISLTIQLGMVPDKIDTIREQFGAGSIRRGSLLDRSKDAKPWMDQ